MPNIGRRAFVAGSAAAVLAKAIPASAQDFPARPITLIIPFPPGGSTTIVIRSVSDKLGEALGQQIVIDNRAGAGGTVGTARAREVRPRRLHHRARLHRHAGDRPEPLRQRRLRPAQGLLLDRADRHGAEHAGGASVVSRQVGAGADRLRQGEPRQGQLRLGRHRHRQSRLRRVFRVRHRHQARAHSLQGHRPGAERPDRRPHPDGVRADPGHLRELPRAARCGCSR